MAGDYWLCHVTSHCHTYCFPTTRVALNSKGRIGARYGKSLLHIDSTI